MISYLSSWFYDPVDPDISGYSQMEDPDPSHKKRFRENVLPDIERFETNKKFKKIVTEINESTSRKLKESDVNTNTNELFVSKQLSNKYLSRLGTNQKRLFSMRSRKNAMYHQPRSTNRFKQT